MESFSPLYAAVRQFVWNLGGVFILISAAYGFIVYARWYILAISSEIFEVTDDSDPDFQKLKEDAIRAGNAIAGWDGYDAPSPNALAVENSLKIIDHLEKTSLKPYSVLPSAEGGLGLSFRGKGGKRVMIEILNNGLVTGMSYGKGRLKIFDEFS